MTEKISIESGESSYERLLALGVPEERAKDWTRLGPKMRATLWTNGPVGVWEVHRELSVHLRIAGWTLLSHRHSLGQVLRLVEPACIPVSANGGYLRLLLLQRCARPSSQQGDHTSGARRQGRE